MILKIKFFYKINLYSSIIKYIQASSFFSFLEKKRTFLDFGWGIGVRFFYWQIQKNAPQFPTQNPQKNWHFEIKKKKRTFLSHQFEWFWVANRGAFFSRTWGKMWFFEGFWVANWGAFFQDPEKKKRTPIPQPKSLKVRFFF